MPAGGRSTRDACCKHAHADQDLSYPGGAPNWPKMAKREKTRSGGGGPHGGAPSETPDRRRAPGTSSIGHQSMRRYRGCACARPWMRSQHAHRLGRCQACEALPCDGDGQRPNNWRHSHLHEDLGRWSEGDRRVTRRCWECMDRALRLGDAVALDQSPPWGCWRFRTRRNAG